LGEILFGVIDDVVCANRSDHVYIPRATHTGDVRAEGLGDLHGKRSNATRRTVDQDLLPRLNPSFVAKALQGGESRHRDGCRLLECEMGRFQSQSPFVGTHVLSESAAGRAEYLITWFELSYVPANCFNPASHIGAESYNLWFAQSGHHAEEVRGASHKVPVKRIDGSRPNFYQNFIVPNSRLFNLYTLKDIG
jgi:hypothetical protein